MPRSHQPFTFRSTGYDVIRDGFCVAAACLAPAVGRLAADRRRPSQSSRRSWSPPRLRPADAAANCPVSITVLDAGALEAAGLQHLQDVLGARAEPQLVRRHVPAALLPAARHRRARAVPGRAESVGRLPDRRHRLLRRRHAGHARSTSSRSRCCAARRARATAPMRSPGLINVRSRRPATGARAVRRGHRRRRRHAGCGAGGRRPARPTTRSREPGASPPNGSQPTASATTVTSIATTPTAATRSTVRGKLRARAAGELAAGRHRCCTSISTTATTPSRSTTRCDTLSDQPGRDAQRSSGAVAAMSRATWGPYTLQPYDGVRRFRHRLQLRRRLGQRAVLGRIRTLRLFLALRPRAPHAEPGPASASARRPRATTVSAGSRVSMHCVSTKTTCSATNLQGSCSGRCSRPSTTR